MAFFTGGGKLTETDPLALKITNNLSDLANAATARTNLDVYSKSEVDAAVVTDHGALTGLLDDDHTQYLLVAGTRAMSGDLNMAQNALTQASSLVLDATGSNDWTIGPTPGFENLAIDFANETNIFSVFRFLERGHTESVLLQLIFKEDVGATNQELFEMGAVKGSSDYRLMSQHTGTGSTRGIDIYVTDDDKADAVKAKGIKIRGADKVSGTGDGGDVFLSPGSSVGGSKGIIDADSSLISNVLDPVGAQDAATKNYVDTNAVSDHGALTGLLDDDHTQYVLADGTRSMAGATITTNPINFTQNLGNFNVEAQSASYLHFKRGNAGFGGYMFESGTNNGSESVYLRVNQSSTNYAVLGYDSGAGYILTYVGTPQTWKIGSGGNPSELVIEADGQVQFNKAAPVLLPRLTTTERNAFTAVNGMIIYNTTDNKVQVYEGGAWANVI